MSREVHVRFWESAEVGFLRATRLPLYRQVGDAGRSPYSREYGGFFFCWFPETEKAEQ